MVNRSIPSRGLVFFLALSLLVTWCSPVAAMCTNACCVPPQNVCHPAQKIQGSCDILSPETALKKSPCCKFSPQAALDAVLQPEAAPSTRTGHAIAGPLTSYPSIHLTTTSWDGTPRILPLPPGDIRPPLLYLQNLALLI